MSRELKEVKYICGLLLKFGWNAILYIAYKFVDLFICSIRKA
jgi:hypothetical protein